MPLAGPRNERSFGATEGKPVLQRTVTSRDLVAVRVTRNVIRVELMEGEDVLMLLLNHWAIMKENPFT